MSDPYQRAEIGPIIDAMDRDTIKVRLIDQQGDDVPYVLEQDLLDGAALRRLREALPTDTGPGWNMNSTEGWSFVVHVYKQADRPSVEVHRPTRNYDPDVVVWEEGSTIAEAADKCREALTTHP